MPTETPKKLPSNLTMDQIMESVQSDNYEGYCLACGHQHDGVEPDARGYLCENCGLRLVYGAEELLIMFGI